MTDPALPRAGRAGEPCHACGRGLAADQRYCLSCGQPASPVRLAFLDVLQNDPSAGLAQPTLEMTPAGYVPLGEGRGANGWLRRNSGVVSLLAVLVLCLIAGLLIGHWASQGNKTPAKQVVEVKGLSGLAAAPAATPGAGVDAPDGRVVPHVPALPLGTHTVVSVRTEPGAVTCSSMFPVCGIASVAWPAESVVAPAPPPVTAAPAAGDAAPLTLS